MIHLVTSFYLPECENRKNELLKALEKNVESCFISKIHLFLDSEDCIKEINKTIKDKESKICIVLSKIGTGQPLYSDLFRYANSLKNNICMVSNGDIWLQDIRNTTLIDYINDNPEIGEKDFGCYDEKPYFDVYLDDKAGFDAEVEWRDIFNFLREDRRPDERWRNPIRDRRKTNYLLKKGKHEI